jgi:hypothetical protein
MVAMVSIVKGPVEGSSGFKGPGLVRVVVGHGIIEYGTA